MTTPNTVNIEGIGNVLPYIHDSFDGINIDDIPVESQQDENHHGEGVPAFTCEEEHPIWFPANDVVKFKGSLTASGGYQLHIAFNTDSETSLYNDGNIILNYDVSNHQWKMAAVAENKVWRFCDANAVVNTIVDSIECYCASDTQYENVKETLTAVKESIINNQDAVVDSAIGYAFASDCSQSSEETTDDTSHHYPVSTRSLGAVSDGLPAQNTQEQNSQMVFIKGLGNLPAYFELYSDQVDLFLQNNQETNDQMANDHLESNLKLECKEENDISFNDEVTVTGQATETGGYEVVVSFDAEGRMPITHNGSFTLNYNPTDQQWDLAGVADNMPWRFCSAEGAIDLVNSVLGCLSTQNPEIKPSLITLSTSFEAQKNIMATNALPFLDRDDCSDTIESYSSKAKEIEYDWSTYPM